MANIKSEVLDTMADNLDLINDLAKEHNRSHESIKRWIKTDSILLCSPASMRVIRKHIKIPANEIIADTTA